MRIRGRVHEPGRGDRFHNFVRLLHCGADGPDGRGHADRD